MLDTRITVQNERVVIEDLRRIGAGFKPAGLRAVRRAAAGIYSIAYQWLSGAGGQTKSYSREWSAGGEVRKKKKYGAAAGGYPVPVRTGHLRGMLAWLSPGESKSGDVGTVTAGADEFLVFDSASYAMTVFEGMGSSKEYGKRDAITDAFEYFNHGGQIQQMVSEEMRKELNANT
jgi:hypothetical protein